MNKPFLLIAGRNYYPCGGTEDWIDRFETEEQAKEAVIIDKSSSWGYTINGNYYDWFSIVNLDTWQKDS